MVVDIASLHTGDFFGEMSLLTGEPRSASVSALVLLLLLLLPALLQRNFDFHAKLPCNRAHVHICNELT